MTLRTLLLLAQGVLLVVGAASAAGRVDDMMARASTPAELRATLLDFARTAPDSAKEDKGQALLQAGWSYHEAGRADSALICFDRAVAIRGSHADRDAFVDALFDRSNTGDAARALEVLGPRLVMAKKTSERDIAQTRGRQGWAHYLMSRGDSALRILRTHQRLLLDPATPRHRDWRYRLGLVELEHGDAAKSIEAIYPLSIESRFTDRDVMSILRDASRKIPQSDGFADRLKQELNRNDELDRKAIEEFRGKRITFTAADGVTIGAIVVPSMRRPARAAVVLMDPDELPEAYDSLATGMSAAGYSIILVEPRGSGWSVSPECPLPSLWRGREDEMRSKLARDALPALRALSAKAPADTSAYVVIGAMGSSSAAADAASRERRVRGLVLLSPTPSPVEVGPMRARLAQSAVPVFFEVPVMDHATGPTAQTLYEGLDPRTSRIAESEIVGSSAKIFRYDRTALPRLLTWLNDRWKRPAPPSSKRKS
ncbi:MAG TPA: hypothetical protein VFQ05_10335 [Candidatus Eisenbacteria bacterium]|nr:hypothetical protein [Candidatus Eisenbacteria bacterium]